MSSRTRIASVTRHSMVALLFAALMVLGWSAPANAVTQVELTLHLALKSGAPLEGVNVEAYAVENHEPVGGPIYADWGTDGVYTFSGGTTLDSGQEYAFYFDAPDDVTTTFDQYYGGTTFVEEAKYWSSTDPTNDLNVTLASNSAITGKVTGVGGKGLKDVDVTPYRWDGNTWIAVGPVCGCPLTTNAAGVYSLTNLEPGTYRLYFQPDNLTGYTPRYSGNGTVFDDAKALTVGLGAALQYNMSLVIGGKITGTVTLTDATDGISEVPSDVTAVAYPVLPGGGVDSANPYVSLPTDDSGKWSIPGLAAGQYKVKLYDDFGLYVERWVGGGESVAAATVFTVSNGQTKGAGVTDMPYFPDNPVSSVDFGVNDHNGDPLDFAWVTLVATSGQDNPFPDFIVNNGDLGIPYLPPGDYQLFIDPANDIDQPVIVSFTVVAGTPYTDTINLAPISAFSYGVPASTTVTDTVAGTSYTINKGGTSYDDGVSPDSPVTYSYLWLRDGHPIFGWQSAASDHYTSRGADVGHQLSVIVKAEAFGFAPVFSTVVVADPEVTPGAAPSALTPPSITGPASPIPGSTLTANTGGWDQPGLTYTYTWYRGAGTGTIIGTAKTYKATIFDAGQQLHVTVTASRVGYGTGNADSAPYAVGSLAKPKITKTPKFSVSALSPDAIRLKVTTGASTSPAATSIEYDWIVAGSPVGSGTTLDCGVGMLVPCSATGTAIEVDVVVHRTGSLDAVVRYVVRKGTAIPGTAPGPIGFVYDAADVGHTPLTSGSLAQVGHVLKAANPVYSYPGNHPGAVKITYQWQRLTGTTWASISKATKITYAPTTADIGHQLRVRTVTTASLYPTVTEYFSGGTGALKQDLQAGTTVIMTGSPVSGSVKRVTVGAWPVTGVTQKFQWFACDNSLDCSDRLGANWLPIAGATGSSYTPNDSLLDHLLLAQVTGSKTGYASKALRSSDIGPIVDTTHDDLIVLEDPTITSGMVNGDAVVGLKITAKPSVLDRSGPSVVRYIGWYLCNDIGCSSFSNIPYGDGETSIVPQPDLLVDGQPHWLQYHEDIFVGTSSTSTALIVPLSPATWKPITAPTAPATDTSVPGVTTYTATNGTWPGGITPSFAYDWYVGTGIVGHDPYVIASNGTEPVWGVITASRTGYHDVQLTVVARKGVLPAQTLQLAGARYGDTLQLQSPPVIPANTPAAKLTYQWYLGSKAIKGATKATLKPTTSYIGKSIKLNVTITSSFYATSSSYTAPITLLPHLAAIPTGPVVVVSTPNTFLPGVKLTPPKVFASGFTTTYRWERSSDGGTTWSLASTKSSIVVGLSGAGKKIRLTMTLKRTGWATGTFTTPGADIGFAPPLATTVPFALTGTAMVDHTLTATTTWNTPSVTLAYQWLRNGVVIPGATSATVTPTASWSGDEVVAKVTATKVGYAPVTVTSNEVTIADAPLTSSAVKFSPTVVHTGDPVTASNQWSGGGLTITYSWVLKSDPGNVLGTSSTFIPPAPGVYTVTISAHGPGYAATSVSADLTVT